MSAETRWAIHRDRAPFSPIYLGDVLAADRPAAERLGAQQYGAPVVALRTPAREASPALERALRKASRSVTHRDPGRRPRRRA